jgi:hypothetical protein
MTSGDPGNSVVPQKRFVHLPDSLSSSVRCPSVLEKWASTPVACSARLRPWPKGTSAIAAGQPDAEALDAASQLSFRSARSWAAFMQEYWDCRWCSSPENLQVTTVFCPNIPSCGPRRGEIGGPSFLGWSCSTKLKGRGDR